MAEIIAKYIDVSKYQVNVDWRQVKASGIDGAMLRAVSTNSGGIYQDPSFEQNYAECKKLGIPVGAYYYTYAQTQETAERELAAFRNALKGKSFELPIVVDVEDNLLKPLSSDRLTDLVVFALRRMETWGAYAMVYTYTSYKNTELNMERLSNYDLWQADYRGAAYEPKGVGIWQYTSSGSVPGISGGVDLNHVYRDYPSIIRRAGLNDFTGNVPEKTYQPISASAVRLCIGPASKGDVRQISAQVSSLGITSEVDEGYIYTSVVSAGDQVTILKLCSSLGVPAREYVEITITEEAGNITEPEQVESQPEEEPKKSWIIRLLEFILELLRGE